MVELIDLKKMQLKFESLMVFIVYPYAIFLMYDIGKGGSKFDSLSYKIILVLAAVSFILISMNYILKFNIKNRWKSFESGVFTKDENRVNDVLKENEKFLFLFIKINKKVKEQVKNDKDLRKKYVSNVYANMFLFFLNLISLFIVVSAISEFTK